MEAETIRPIRRCKIKLATLAQDLNQLSGEVTGFLDLEAGETIFVTEEVARELERLYVLLSAMPANASNEEQRAALEAAAKQESPGLVQNIMEADAADRGLGTRYVALPMSDTREDYDDMQAFVDTIEDDRLRSRMDRAIHGRGAFRRFRDELRDTENEEQRWYVFKQQRLEARALDWLADEGIELVTE